MSNDLERGGFVYGRDAYHQRWRAFAVGQGKIRELWSPIPFILRPRIHITRRIHT